VVRATVLLRTRLVWAMRNSFCSRAMVYLWLYLNEKHFSEIVIAISINIVAVALVCWATVLWASNGLAAEA
jgi:hypothetical protein